MTFKSKAENLGLVRGDKSLRKVLKIPKFFFFKKKNLKKNLNKIYDFLNKNDCILRSSSLNEDKKNKSNAGLFDSFILKKKSPAKLIENRLKKICLKIKDNDHILVQKFISSVSYSGVIFSSDIRTNSPYISLEYDKSGKTDYITSGKKKLNVSHSYIKKNF